MATIHRGLLAILVAGFALTASSAVARVRPFVALLLAFLRSAAFLLVSALAFTNFLAAQSVYDVATSFEQGWTTHSNPNGVWSYGWSSSFSAPVTLYDQMHLGTNGPNTQTWISSTVDNQTSPAAEFNDGPAYNQGNVALSANQFALVAGVGGQFSDLVFTAPAYGVYSVLASFQGAQSGVGTVVGVVENGTVLLTSSVTSEGQTVPFNTVVSLNAGDTVVFSVGPGGGKQNTALSATITSLALGYVNPKYLIMGVTYAPPGGNSNSFVSYQNSNLVGNTSMNSSSFANGFNESVSVGLSLDAWQDGTSVTGMQSSGWTQKTTISNSVTINKTNSTTLKTPGVPNVYSPVDHDYDIIWLWLNPVALFAAPSAGTSAGGSVIWNGYGYDLNDPLQDIDVWPVYVGYLNGDFGPLDAQDAGALSRSWVTMQTFAPGQGPGITSADYPNILGADPFAKNPYDANSGYILTLASGTNPPTSTDGRFTASQTGDASQQSIPYPQAPLNSTTGIQDTYQLTNLTTATETQTSDYTYP